MKISVGVKIFGVVVVLMILVGAAAWYNADKLQDVQTLLQDVHDTYIPAYQGLARANLRSVEEGLYAPARDHAAAGAGRQGDDPAPGAGGKWQIERCRCRAGGCPAHHRPGDLRLQQPRGQARA